MIRLNGFERNTRYLFQLVVMPWFHDVTDESRNIEEDWGAEASWGKPSDLARRTRTSVKEHWNTGLCRQQS